MLKMQGTQAENKGKNGNHFHKDGLFLYSTTKDFLKIDGMNQTEQWINKLLTKFLGISACTYQLFSYKSLG